MENLLISKEGAQKILNYLAQRPYVEVFEVIPHILNLVQHEVQQLDKEVSAEVEVVEQAVGLKD